MDKIFLLEDDAYLRDGLCEMLESQGYSVKSADTINEAQKIIKNEHFSLLIFEHSEARVRENTGLFKFSQL